MPTAIAAISYISTSVAGRHCCQGTTCIPALASQPPTAGQSSAMAAGNQRLVASQPTGAGQFSAVAAGLEVMWLCWGLHSPQLMLTFEEWRRHSHCNMQSSSHSIDPRPGPAQSPWILSAQKARQPTPMVSEHKPATQSTYHQSTQSQSMQPVRAAASKLPPTHHRTPLKRWQTQAGGCPAAGSTCIAFKAICSPFLLTQLK
jgi:hypothetical protein